MNYAKMSDFEINKMITKHLLTDGWRYNKKEKGFIYEADGDFYPIYDYCNNPSDAWPIFDGIIKSDCIVQILKAGVIVALAGGGRIQCMHKNPLRAAMIVFLMMNEGK